METKETEKICKRKQSFADFRLERVPNGVSLYVKSQAIEDFFRSRHDGSPKEACASWDNAGEQYAYRLGIPAPAFPVLGQSYNCLWEYSGRRLFQNGLDGPNIGVLMSRGLGEGITVVYRGVFPRSVLVAYAECFQQAIRRMFLEYCSPFRASFILSVEEGA